MADAAPNILVVRRRYLGDIVLLGSVLRNLRLHWPTARLTVLTEQAYAGVLALNPDVDAALVFPKGVIGWTGFVRKLRGARFTHVLDFDNTEKTALVSRVTGAPLRATFNRELIPFRYPRFYTHIARVTNDFYDTHHITETYLALLAPVGVPVVSRDVRLVPRASDHAAVALWAGTGHVSYIKLPPRVLLHPGSRSPFRLWPPERFAAVCDRLHEALGVQVFVVAGPGEQELVQQIQACAQFHVVALTQRFTVGQFAALVSSFDLFLCHDSGPMHVAAAVGTPLVALFGSQNATIWRPLGPRSTVLQTTLPCVCLMPDTPSPCEPSNSYRSYCVRKLTEGEVFTAIANQLALKQEKKQP